MRKCVAQKDGIFVIECSNGSFEVEKGNGDYRVTVSENLDFQSAIEYIKPIKI